MSYKLSIFETWNISDPELDHHWADWLQQMGYTLGPIACHDLDWIGVPWTVSREWLKFPADIAARFKHDADAYDVLTLLNFARGSSASSDDTTHCITHIQTDSLAFATALKLQWSEAVYSFEGHAPNDAADGQ
jgi:hypothetical protein